MYQILLLIASLFYPSQQFHPGHVSILKEAKEVRIVEVEFLILFLLPIFCLACVILTRKKTFTI